MQRKHEPEVVEQVLQWAKNKGWLPDDPESLQKLSEQMSQGLHRRKKGIAYINQKLQSIGLPPLKADGALELEKAQTLVENKFSHLDLKDPKTKAKAHRFLMSRGFSQEIIQKILKAFSSPARSLDVEA